MELNGGVHRDFLNGEEEVQAFQENEFMRMHNSTLCKVGFLFRVISKFQNGRLKTDTCGFGVALDKLFESRAAKAIGLFGTIIGIAAAIMTLLKFFRV